MAAEHRFDGSCLAAVIQVGGRSVGVDVADLFRHYPAVGQRQPHTGRTACAARCRGGAGGAACMRLALADGGVVPEQIGYINAHGTSTHLNDSCETTAIKTVFGGHAYKLAVSSTKSMTGHLLGGAGGVEGVFTALALHDAFLPATVNLQEPDPELDLDYIPNHGRAAQVEYAMSDSLGFGGHNACVVFKRWEG